MTNVTWGHRPVIGATAYLATYWPAVNPYHHGLYRSVLVGRSQNAEGQADYSNPVRTASDCQFWKTEVVPGVGVATMQAWPPSSLPHMNGRWSLSAASSFRYVKTELTRETWIKLCVAAGNLTSLDSFHWEPGILLRMLFYAPTPSTTSQAFVTLRIYQAGSYRLSYRFPRAVSGSYSSAGDSVRPGVFFGNYADNNGPSAVYDGGWDITPGEVINLRLRIIAGYAVMYGEGIAAPWVTKLPEGLFDTPATGTLRIDVDGGMAAFHATQLSYLLGDGTVSERLLYVTPPTVTATGMDGTAYAHELPSVGTHVTVYGGNDYLQATMSGSPYASPLLLAMSERREPTYLARVTTPTTLANLTGFEIKLNSEGRGQTATATFHDPTRTITTGLKAGQIVALSGKWDNEVSAVTLFRGRITSPLEWRKSGTDRRPAVRIQLADDWPLLERKLMGPLNLTGCYAGRIFSSAVFEVLASCGVASTRIVENDTTNVVLRPKNPDELQFRPGEHAGRALDVLCKARGWVWWIDQLGDYHFGPEATYGTPVLTLDDTNATGLTFFDGLGHELTIGEWNSVMVQSQIGGVTSAEYLAPAAPVTTPSDWRFSGQDTWEYVDGELDNPLAEAVKAQGEGVKRRRAVSWHMPYVDLQTPILPRASVAIGTVADVELAAGTQLIVRDVTIRVDCDSGTAEGDYTATVENVP